jgi:hypothetical protein
VEGKLVEDNLVHKSLGNVLVVGVLVGEYQYANRGGAESSDQCMLDSRPSHLERGGGTFFLRGVS